LGRIVVGATLALVWHTSIAAGAAELGGDANASLQKLYASVPAAKALGAKAQAILVFPKVTKAGLGVGGQFGEGALLKGGKAVAYYNTAGASVGLQAGAQQFVYAMFFMNENALAQLDKSGGFEVGVGPTVVVVDEGKAKTMTTTTAKDDIYAFIFRATRSPRPIRNRLRASPTGSAASTCCSRPARRSRNIRRCTPPRLPHGCTR
jgi:lipid-binding SYLF domain-containing protein